MIGTNALWDINPDLLPGMEKPPAWAQGPASSQAWNYLYQPIRYTDAPAGGVAMPDGRMNPGVRKLPANTGKSIFNIRDERLAAEKAAGAGDEEKKKKEQEEAEAAERARLGGAYGLDHYALQAGA
jgi:hypothetical protein